MIKGDKNFYFLQDGDYEIKIYNPDNVAGSPAGDYRITINYTSPLAGTGTSGWVLGGDAVGGWVTDLDANRLSWINPRYAAVARDFTAGDFKFYIWKTWDADFGFSGINMANSNAANELSAGGGDNVTLATAGNYMAVYDAKFGKFYFHHATTTYRAVTKYYGANVLEQEAAFSGLDYVPSECKVAGKKLVGWYTDETLTTPYVPGEVTSDFNLYGKFVDSIKLAFYDKAKTISAGTVYAYGWKDGGAGETLGAWPGTVMTNHGYGYHTLDVIAANVCENLVFNNGLSGADEVKTVDLRWNMPFNIYHNINNAWGTNSDDYHTATLFGIEILEATENCDDTGAVNNVLQADWTTLANNFATLSSDVKTLIKNHVGNPSGDILDNAIARYDFIVTKYDNTQYPNFINRTYPPSPLQNIALTTRNYLLIGLMAVSAIVGVSIITFFNFKRRKENAI